jgi:hypothetical protein
MFPLLQVLLCMRLCGEESMVDLGTLQLSTAGFEFQGSAFRVRQLNAAHGII